MLYKQNALNLLQQQQQQHILFHQLPYTALKMRLYWCFCHHTYILSNVPFMNSNLISQKGDTQESKY